MMKRDEERLSVCREALQKFPKDRKLLTQMKQAYLKVGAPDKAIELGRKCASDNPDSGYDAADLARIYGAVKQYDQALPAWESAVKLTTKASTKLKYQYELFGTYLRTGRIPDADALERTMLEAAPNDKSRKKISDRVKRIRGEIRPSNVAQASAASP